MSEFDKEAEREKLREQFAEEEKERAETQQMSDLLLRGATMTNKHCNNCGSPIFRQNGEAFCPNCGGESTAVAAGAADQGQSPEGEVPAAESADATPETGGSAATEPRPDPSASTPADADSDGRTRSDPGAEGSAGTAASAETGDLAAARAGLVRTLEKFVREAEATDDAGRARELLATAREAAETLEAVDRLD